MKRKNGNVGDDVENNPVSGFGLDDDRRALATRIAWMYFIEGLKQEEIAHVLGVSRLRVIRLLAAAKTAGIVRIEIDSPDFGIFELERRLCERFGTRRATLVPTPQDPQQVLAVVGYALGKLLNTLVKDGITIGVNHGRSVHSMFNGMKPVHLPNVNSVSLMGSLSPQGRMVPQETVARLALILDARCYQLAAPRYARSPNERALFLVLPMVQTVLELGRACDIAVFTASRMSEEGVLVSTGYLTPQTAAELRAQGAVGAILGAFIDRDGHEIDHPINTSRIGLDLADLDRVPINILVGGGSAKVSPLFAALNRGHIHHLVTDIDTANAILDL